MNSVLVQELVRCNRLLDTVRESLGALRRALRGEVVLSLDLECVMDAMYDGRVPALWKNVSYPSLKPLGSWVRDLVLRLNMFRCGRYLPL